MTKEFATTGMIIKETKVGEGSKIFTLLTPNMGKIQASGAGVRSYKSKISAGCSLFCYSDFKLRQGKSKDILNIVSAEKKMDFFDIRYDVQKLALASYITDISGRMSVSQSDCADILRLLLNTMYYIQKNDYSVKIKAVFELRLAVEAGFAPQLTVCHKCGGTQNLVKFSAQNSAVECLTCANSQNICKDTLNAMRYIIKSQQKNIFGFEVSDDVLQRLCHCTEDYIIHLLGSVPKSLIYLKSL